MRRRLAEVRAALREACDFAAERIDPFVDGNAVKRIATLRAMGDDD